MTTLKAAVVMAKCSHHTHKSFGIRLEEKLTGQWFADWAFAIKESAVKREGYDHSEIRGTFALDTTYPGCPFCEKSSIVRCCCGGVSCWNENEEGNSSCAWCGTKVKVTGEIYSLSVGVDR